MPRIVVKRGDLDEHDPWNRHRLAYNMNLWDFSYSYAVLTLPINQNIDGIKSFYNFPVVPIGFPIENEQVANKFYVDYMSTNSVTFENLFSNGDVGTGANQVARGNHIHTSLPTDDQKDAMDTSQNPSASNPFITYNQFSAHSSRHITTGQDKIADVSNLLSGLMKSSDKLKLDNIFESQGTLYTHDNGLTINAVLASTPYLINNLSEGYKTSDTNLIQLNGSNGRITVGSGGSGVYFILYTISMQTDKATTLHFELYKNGVALDPCSFERKIANANDTGSGSANTLLSLSGGDYLEVKLDSSVSNTTITIDHMNFTVIRTI